jgi:hypothetical protein
MQLRSVAIFMFFVVILCGCKKEEDMQSPVIEYIFPSQGHRYDDDIVSLKVRIQDNKQLKYVKIGLVNADYIPLVQSVSLLTYTNDTTIEYSFFLSGIASGFKLFVQASDGVNTKNKYLNVSKNTSSNGQYELFFIEDNGYSSGMRRLSSSGNGAHMLALIDRKIVLATGGGRSGQVYLLTDFPSVIRAQNFSNGSLLWEYAAPMPETEINHMFVHNDKLLVGEKSGILRLVNAIGGQNVAVNQSNMDNEPLLLMMDDDLVYSWQRSKISQQKTLGLFYQGTLSHFRSIHVDDGLIGIFPGTNNDVILLHYMNNVLKVNRLYKINQNVDFLFELELSDLIRARSLGNNEILLIHSSQLSRLNITNGSVTKLIEHPDITDGLLFGGGYCFVSGKSIHFQNNDSLTFQGYPTLLMNAFHLYD